MGVITAIVISVVVTGLLLMVILLPISIKTLNSDEYGIKYHHVTKKFTTDKVYEQGRYTLQPGESFFKFKRRYVTIAISDVLCLCQDGLQASLEITFQYRLNKTYLVNFFENYGTGYETIITQLAETAARDSCGNFTAEGFYYTREQVQQDMEDRVTKAFSAINVDTGFLQLSNVELPDEFQAIVSSTQEAKQDADQAINERAGNLTTATTLVLQAQQTASVIIVNATADATGIEAAANADAESILASLAAQATTYQSIMQELDLTADDLINYIALQTIQAASNPIISVEAPASFSFSSK